MSANKHTPGPWKRDGLRIDNGYGFTVAVVSAESLHPDSETLEGNLDLISAAPELLEALEYLAGECDKEMDLDYNRHAAPLAKALAAIAKAKGEQQ